MLICNNCGDIISEDELGTICEKEIVDCGVGQLCVSRNEYYPGCSCGGEFEQATECEFCGEYFLDSDNNHICKNCLDENSTYENALSFGAEKDCKEKIEINGYLAHEFTIEQIETILKKELAEANKLTHLKYKEFLLEDSGAFASWIIKNS